VTLRLGTRASALALAQARAVGAALRKHRECEVIEISTGGDRGAGPQDKSRWVDELERALLEERIDVAVHSAKDVPGELGEGLEIVAVPTREDPRDALCGAASLADVPSGARVGTSSLRRRAQILAGRDDVEIVSLRGNVDTRLRKLGEGECDALVLAYAGLRRLGRGDAATACLDFVPAPGQGALALQARTGDEPTRAALRTLDDAEAHICLRAERAFGRALGATCHTPVGAHARVAGARLALRGFAGLPDGSEWIRDELDGDEPEPLGRALAERMLSAGARGLLESSEAWSRARAER
jgi:hydroxymethylbilane synthase